MIDNSKNLVNNIGLEDAFFTVIFGLAYIIALFVTLAELIKPPWDMIYEVILSIFLTYPNFSRMIKKHVHIILQQM